MNIIEIASRFSTEEACLEYLAEVRWPNGATCPHCESTEVRRLSTRREYQCNECRKQFSATSGTIMHRSHLPLTKWLITLHLVCSAKKGLSACQLQRHIGVNYRTAWYLLHRIRSAMSQDEIILGFTGVLEADETYMHAGLKPKPSRSFRGKRRGRGTNKVPVAGVMEKGGRIRTQVVTKVCTASLVPFIVRYGHPGQEIHTDQLMEYTPLKRYGFNHRSVNHLERYVDGEIHTNGIESFWSLLKRGVIGSYHHVSLKYLPLYLNEFESRFNARHENNGSYFKALLGRCLEVPNLLAGLTG